MQPGEDILFHRAKFIVMGEDSQLQMELYRLQNYANQNQMVINCDKSKVMLFNTGRKYDFMPRLQIEDGTFLSVVEEFKLLGVVLQSNLKWYSNT